MSHLFGRFVQSMPFYAVRVGKIPGVYKDWNKCKEQVHGFSKPVFKKFNTYVEAFEFAQLGTTNKKAKRRKDQVLSSSSTGETSLSGNKKSSNPLKMGNQSMLGKVPRRTLYTNPHHKAQTLQEKQCTCGASENRNEFPDLPVVYSDGCCYKNGRNGARAGIGVFWAPGDSRNVARRLEGDQTNQRAELTAAIVAVEGALQGKLPGVEVRTDSMYTINCVTSWVEKWKRNGWRSVGGGKVKNQDLVKRLDGLCREIPVKWVHVAGHSGNFGNDQADILSKKGAMEESLGSNKNGL